MFKISQLQFSVFKSVSTVSTSLIPLITAWLWLVVHTCVHTIQILLCLVCLLINTKSDI